MAIEVCVGRLLMTHPRGAPRARRCRELRERLEGARRRLLLLPEPNARQLGGVVARLGALAAETPKSQLR